MQGHEGLGTPEVIHALHKGFRIAHVHIEIARQQHIFRSAIGHDCRHRVGLLPHAERLPDRIRCAKHLAGEGGGQHRIVFIQQRLLRVATDHLIREELKEVGIDRPDMGGEIVAADQHILIRPIDEPCPAVDLRHRREKLLRRTQGHAIEVAATDGIDLVRIGEASAYCIFRTGVGGQQQDKPQGHRKPKQLYQRVEPITRKKNQITFHRAYKIVLSTIAPSKRLITRFA